MWEKRYVVKSWLSLQQYSMERFRKDVIAGVIVGIVAIPLGMAFSIASGVKPEYGLYTTIIAGILVAIFGGSRFQIAGPTGAFIPVLLAIVLQYGYEQLLIAGFMAGVIMLLMGIFKLGRLIQYIPRPVTIGFTSGIAVIIFSGQIANFLGMADIEKHEYFLLNMREILVNLHLVNGYSVLIGILCFIFLLVTRRLLPKVPSPLVAIVATTIIGFLLFEGKLETIGSAFGSIPHSLPAFQLPDIRLSTLLTLIGPALVIAALGSIESLLSCVVADGMTGTRHDSNKELCGQGIANMVTPLFGGIPATGAIARTATNIKSGAVSRVSGIVHSLFVLLVLLLFAPYASLIPLASMAPILMVVAWNMSERKRFMAILKTKSSDALVLIATFLLTVFTNLTIAVGVGLVCALLLFVKRMSETPIVVNVLPDPQDSRKKVAPHVVSKSHYCPQISMYTVDGPLFFGTAQNFEQGIMNTIQAEPKILILRMKKVPFMDTTGEDHLSSVIQHFHERGGTILISGMRPTLKQALKNSHLYEQIGAKHFFAHTGDALNYALERLNLKQCLGCTHFAFRECRVLSSPNHTNLSS